MSKVNVLIVEDEPAIAGDIHDILEIEGYNVVDTAYTYDKAIDLLASKSIDLIFLDIALKGVGNGLDVAAIVNSKYQIPFIFLTSFSDQETIKEVVDLNPNGYLVKPFKERDIVAAAALALAQAKAIKKETFPNLEEINKHINKPLSPQEYNVLLLIWKGKKNLEIAEELYVSINTIKTHVTKIYSKLDVNSRSQAINKVINWN